jgi:hypothetical protein
MSGVTLQLGPFLFQDFEIPSRVTLGGQQRLAVHQLPGGRRIIDALGRSDSEIRFSAIFSGEDATLRARSLDRLRVTASVLALSWDVFFYSVIINRFDADYRNPWWIPFRVACTVLRDEAESLTATIVSLSSEILADIATAITYTDGTGLDLSPVSSVLSNPTATVKGTAAYAAAQASASEAQGSIGSGIQGAEASLNVLGPTLFKAGSATDGVAAVNGATGAAYQLSALGFAKAFTGRVASNLAAAST